MAERADFADTECMKHFVKKSIPFVAVLALLVLSVVGSYALRARKGDVVTINTGLDADGGAFTVRVLDSVSSVVAIDASHHSRRKEIPSDAYFYDAQTTRLTFTRELPYKDAIIHIEGKAAQPEQFFLHDFSGDASSLFVALDGRRALEGLEYTYDTKTRLVTFRSDIHPEQDGNFHIGYLEGNAMHGFGNWARKDMDTLSELQGQWMHSVHDMPMMVMKDRSRATDRALSREAGFYIRLPKGTVTFITETMEENERQMSVQRWYDKSGLMIECRSTRFQNTPADDAETETLTLKKISVTKRHITGSVTDADGTETPAPLTEYTWERGGIYYLLTAQPEQEADAERLLLECGR